MTSSPISSRSRRRVSPCSTGSTALSGLAAFRRPCPPRSAAVTSPHGQIDQRARRSAGRDLLRWTKLGRDRADRKRSCGRRLPQAHGGIAPAPGAGQTCNCDAPRAPGIRPWLMPRGGFYLWCRLPEGQDPTTLARRALEERVVLAPGNVFSVSQTATPFLRFNVAQSYDPRILAALKRAMDRRHAA